MEIRIIGVPVFQGCNIRGVEKAPAALRCGGVFDCFKDKFTFVDQGDLDLLPSDESKMFDADKSVKYYDVLLDMNRKLCDVVKQNTLDQAFTVVVGGDHSLGVGSVAGASIALGHNLGVVWFDAHSDINTPLTSPSKNFHGMPLATSMYVGPKEMRSIGVDKRKVKPTDAFLVGVRSMDIGEVEFKDSQGVNHYTMAFIRKRGMAVLADEIIETLHRNGIDKIHFSFDLDSLSPEVTMAYNCPVNDGVTLEECLTFVKRLFASGKVSSMDYTEYNPDLDKDGKGLDVARQIFSAIAEELKFKEQKFEIK